MTGFPVTLATPPAFTGPLPEAVDVAVIGGGIIGLMAAWSVASEGKRVLLCEKGRLAGEQSSRNWGWIRQQGRDVAELPVMMEAIRLWADLPRALRDAIGFRQRGITYFARTETRMDAFARWLDLARPYGVDSRLLSRRETEAMLPNAAGWTGALHTPSDAMAEPFVTAPVLARAAAEEGVVIREGCAVRGLETSSGRLSAIVTEAGTVRCTQAILAGGAWSALFLRSVGVALPQLSVLSSVSATARLPAFFQGAACDDRFAFRRRADGSYLLTPWSFHEFYIGPDAFRNLRAFLPQIRADLSSTRFHPAAPRGYPDAWSTPRRWNTTDESPFERCRILNPRPNGPEIARLQDHFAAAFPAIGVPEIAATWAGMIDVLPDALPVIDHAPLPGLILATGMSGHGFGIAPGIAKVVADLAAGRRPRLDAAAFRYGRFGNGTSLAKSSAL